MLIRFVIFLIIIYLIYRIIKIFRKAKIDKANSCQSKPEQVVREDLIEDSFCHTYIPISQAYKKEIAGKDHYFCSKECCEKYLLEESRKRQ